MQWKRLLSTTRTSTREGTLRRICRPRTPRLLLSRRSRELELIQIARPLEPLTKTLGGTRAVDVRELGQEAMATLRMMTMGIETEYLGAILGVLVDRLLGEEKGGRRREVIPATETAEILSPSRPISEAMVRAPVAVLHGVVAPITDSRTSLPERRTVRWFLL
jgi:hypothetical protein